MIFETAPEKTPYSVFGEKEARLNRREPTVSITVRFPKALAGRLGYRFSHAYPVWFVRRG